MSHYGIFKNTVLNVKFCFSLMGVKVSFGQELRFRRTCWVILSSEKKMFNLKFFSCMDFNELVYSYFCLHLCVYQYSMCFLNMMSGGTLKPVPGGSDGIYMHSVSVWALIGGG